MIIGRTRIGLEKENPHTYLSVNKYYKISHLSRDFLLKNKITELPVNLNSLVKNNGWHVLSYTKLKQADKDESFDGLIKNNLGFTQKINSGEYYIFYDDTCSLELQRFTIAHEIGHIVLDHFNFPIINREQEANMFATRILMPMCVLYECKIKSPEQLSKMCFVTLTTAQFRFERLQLLKLRNKFYTDENEKRLFKAFKKYINKFKKGLIR